MLNNKERKNIIAMNKMSIYLKIFLDFLFLVFGILFFIYVFPKIIYFFLPFVIGWFISIIANPIVKLMEKKVKIIRKFGSVITIFLSIVLVISIIYIVSYLLIDQILDIINDLPNIMSRFEMQIDEIMNKYTKVYNKLPNFIQIYIDNVRNNIRTQRESIGLGNNAIGIAEIAVKNMVSFFVFLLFTILSAYFFTADKIILESKVKSILPECIIFPLKLIIENFKSAVGGYFKAQIKLMIIIIVILYIGLKIFGITYAFFVAVAIGIIDFLPVLGSGVILVPWALYKLLLKEYYVSSGLILLYILCLVIRQILQPKMVGKSVGVGSFATLFMLYIGYKIGGLIGIIISIPTGIIIINLTKAGLFKAFHDDIKYLLSNISVFRRENADEISDILKKRKYIDRGEK